MFISVLSLSLFLEARAVVEAVKKETDEPLSLEHVQSTSPLSLSFRDISLVQEHLNPHLTSLSRQKSLVFSLFS